MEEQYRTGDEEKILTEEQLNRLRLEIKRIPRLNDILTIFSLSLILIGFIYTIFSIVVLRQSILDRGNEVVMQQSTRVALEHTRVALEEARVELERKRTIILQMEQQVFALQSTLQTTELANVNSSFGWVETEVQADWDGRDIAYTKGIIPRLSVAFDGLCNQERSGAVAVCWQDRRGGYPPGVPSDFKGVSPAWCTYKNASIQLNTPPDGRAPPGIVFVCSKTKSQ